MTTRPPASRDQSDHVTAVAASLAEQLGRGFVYHDRREREPAVEAFATVDALQFEHLDESTARESAEGYVEALWAKDEVEDACRSNGDGEIDPDCVAEADWSAVEAGFERRAEAAGIDLAYAPLTTEAWINHKAGGDYWTPMMEAQMLELRTAAGDPSYPAKPRNGQHGFGPEPARYALGVELHDTRRFEEGCEAMTPYFEYILEAHETDHTDAAADVISFD